MPNYSDIAKLVKEIEPSDQNLKKQQNYLWPEALNKNVQGTFDGNFPKFENSKLGTFGKMRIHTKQKSWI